MLFTYITGNTIILMIWVRDRINWDTKSTNCSHNSNHRILAKQRWIWHEVVGIFVHTYGDTPATPLGQDHLALVLHAHIALHAPCNQTQDQCNTSFQTWTTWTWHGTLCDALEHLGSAPPFSWHLPNVSNGPVASGSISCRGKAARVLVTWGKGITLSENWSMWHPWDGCTNHIYIYIY